MSNTDTEQRDTKARDSLSEILSYAKSDEDISNALHLAFMIEDTIPNGDHINWRNPKKIVGVIQGTFKDASGFLWAVIEAENKIAGIAIAPRDSVKFNFERGFGIRLSQNSNYVFTVKETTAVARWIPENKTSTQSKKNTPKF
jgi:hypothetical protein